MATQRTRQISAVGASTLALTICFAGLRISQRSEEDLSEKRRSGKINPEVVLIRTPVFARDRFFTLCKIRRH